MTNKWNKLKESEGSKLEANRHLSPFQLSVSPPELNPVATIWKRFTKYQHTDRHTDPLILPYKNILWVSIPPLKYTGWKTSVALNKTKLLSLQRYSYCSLDCNLFSRSPLMHVQVASHSHIATCWKQHLCIYFFSVLAPGRENCNTGLAETKACAS